MCTFRYLNSEREKDQLVGWLGEIAGLFLVGYFDLLDWGWDTGRGIQGGWVHTVLKEGYRKLVWLYHKMEMIE